jgi:hypothetical protein
MNKETSYFQNYNKKYFHMKKIDLSVLFLVLFCVFPFITEAQNFMDGGQVHGNFQIDAQYYEPDDKIGADTVPEKFLMNAFGNIIYTNGGFTAGFRYELYLNPLEGFDKRLEGNGIPYRFATYKKDKFEITVGNFYDQFGSGLIFRAYEEWNLGVDNSVDGIRVKISPFKGVTFKGIYGKQRYFWDKSPGIVRGADADFFLNDIFKKWQEKKTKISIGGSFVSVYQPDDPGLKLHLPLNVAAFAGRFNISHGKVNFSGEYAYKINDPDQINNFIYKNGEALLLTASYSQKGLGVLLSAKRIDNMSYKSNRLESSYALDVNFLPPLTKQHTYSMAAMYPYATQPNGEMGLQAQVVYTIQKKSKLGGKYGTTIAVNYSIVNSIDKQKINDTIPIDEYGTLGYKSDFFKLGDTKYFEDFNIEITKKINKKWKLIASYLNIIYNIEVVEGHPGEEMVYANIGILDMTYKFTPKKSLRFEYQQLFTKQDKGDWLAFMLEYTIAPKWFFSVMDQYNYGNPDNNKQLHYYTISAGYTKKTNRIALSYGRQRQGIICVGGVCREVPASNGLTLTLSSSF